MKTIKAVDTFRQLCECCLDQIAAFHTDLLVHDRHWIEGNPGVPFLHATRKWGTHLIGLDRLTSYPARGELSRYMFTQAYRDTFLDGKVEWIKAVEKQQQVLQWLYFDGRKFQTVTYERALDIVRSYISLIGRVWQRPGLDCLRDDPSLPVCIHRRNGRIAIVVADRNPIAMDGSQDKAELLKLILEADGHLVWLNPEVRHEQRCAS